MMGSIVRLGLVLVALAAACAPTMAQASQVARVRRHEGPRIALPAYVALDLRAFDIQGGGLLHIRQMLAPEEALQVARATLRQKIVESRLFEAVDEVTGDPPAGNPGVLLTVALDVVVTTPSFGRTAFASTAHLTGTYLAPGAPGRPCSATFPLRRPAAWPTIPSPSISS